VVDLAVPSASFACKRQPGSAEVQRLEHEPDKGNNWVGSSLQLVGAWDCAGSQQEASASLYLNIRPELRQDYPLNLSISISGGEETNKDSPSNGERNGNSPTWKSPLENCSLEKRPLQRPGPKFPGRGRQRG
jgi:hypothetical protein